jgi:hypothetical protein
MSKQLPYLALDSAGKRTILNDYSLPMSGGKVTMKKETSKMRTMPTLDGATYARLFLKNPDAADRYLAKCTGRRIAVDAAMDDETAARIKEFLKTKLSPGDHAQVCDMLEAAGDPGAEDDLPRAAADAKIGFDQRYPGLAHIKIDNSGLPVRRRAAGQSDIAGFNARFPGLAHIRQA